MGKSDWLGRTRDDRFARVLVLFIGGTLVWQIVVSGKDQVTPLDTALFSLIQLILTGGAAYFGARASAHREFEASLKRAGYSAYRRISDIEHLLLGIKPRTSSPETIEATIESLMLTVRSSVADWADVIGEDIRKHETVERLEAQAAASTQEGKDEIEKLRSELPPQLAIDQIPSRDWTSEQRAAWWFGRRDENEDGLRLSVVSGGPHGGERDVTTLRQGERLQLGRKENGGIEVADEEGQRLGSVMNGLPVTHAVFATGLALCYGSSVIKAEYLSPEVPADVRKRPDYKYFSLRVISKLAHPVPEPATEISHGTITILPKEWVIGPSSA